MEQQKKEFEDFKTQKVKRKKKSFIKLSKTGSKENSNDFKRMKFHDFIEKRNKLQDNLVT